MVTSPPADFDRDGVENGQDLCSQTPIGATVWHSGAWTGCAAGQNKD